jgi:hypothetical protein
MRTLLIFAAFIFSALLINSCSKDDESPKLMKLNGVKIKASFESFGKSLTAQTPDSYKIGLYSVKLIGDPNTPNYTLFDDPNFDNIHEFSFTSGDVLFDLQGGNAIPDGNYASVEFGILYLEMRIQISGINNGVTWRNMRVYLCEYGEFKRGDVVQYSDNGDFEGWLYGRYELPDFLPATPRQFAYTQPPSNNWWMFADKSAEFFGPHGNMAFWSSVPNPYRTQVLLNYQEGVGNTVVLTFNVADTWNFEDKNGDGYFGGQDLDPVIPTQSHMALPQIFVSFIP